MIYETFTWFCSPSFCNNELYEGSMTVLTIWERGIAGTLVVPPLLAEFSCEFDGFNRIPALEAIATGCPRLM